MIIPLDFKYLKRKRGTIAFDAPHKSPSNERFPVHAVPPLRL